jgi:hypothetical protein
LEAESDGDGVADHEERLNVVIEGHGIWEVRYR